MNISVSKKQFNNRKNKIFKKLLIGIIVLFVISVVIALIVFLINKNNISEKYSSYTEKMYRYGLSDLYDNKEATITEKVTNAEMLKIVLAAVGGTTNIDDLYYFGEQEPMNKWLEFSTVRGYNTDINEDDLQQDSNKLEAALIAIRALEGIQRIQVEQSELKISNSKLAKLTSDEQILLKKAVGIDIIENNNSVLSDKHMIKGELNKIAITIIEKFATIYHGSTEGVNIVTDKSKMPSNNEDYPYIIDSIPNDLYEYDFNIITEQNAQTPVEVYKYMGNLYSQIEEIIKNHFESLLNVDYKTITKDTFINSIQPTTLYRLTDDDVQEYVNYVKENNIKLSGKAEPLLPIIYNNGEQFIVRTKLTFEVLNSDTKYNLLFGDEGQKVKYDGKEITMYVDVPMGLTLNSWSLRMYVSCFANYMIQDNPILVIEE